MKPSFALVLTQDTIGLLHRTSQGWQTVGEAAVSDPDLTEALGFLRQSALGLDPRGVTSKVVIPNSEILYTTVKAPGPSAAARRSQIKAALEGMTPYAVRDLVFDWSGKGADVQVAVVARETLQEAEGFASQHRLGPLSFVGSPVAGVFDGEPWFGPAAGAESLLSPGEKVERDNAPVPVPASRVAEVGSGDDAAGAETAEPAMPLPSASASASADPVEMAVDVVTSAAPPLPEVSLPGLPLPLREAALPEVPEAVPMDEGQNPPFGAPPTDALGVTAPVETALPDVTEPAAAPVPLPEPPPSLVTDPTPPPFARPLRGDVIAQSLEVPAEDVIAAAPAAKPTVASSAPAVERLKARLAEQPIDPRRFGNASAGLGPASQPPGAEALTGKSGGTVPALARGAKPVAPATAPVSAPARVGVPGVRPAAARVAAKSGVRGSASMVTSPSIPIPRDRRVNIPGAEAASDARAKAAVEARKTQKPDTDSLTSFGAQQTRRGKPRYLGLILTGVLLIVLAIVAAWSTMITSDNTVETVPVTVAPIAAEPAVELAATPDAAEGVAGATVAAAPEPAQQMPNEEPADSAQTDAADRADAEGLTATAPLATATLATSGGAEATAAPTEAAVIEQPDVPAVAGRNPAVSAQDEIFLAMTDAAVTIADLVALAPPVASADPAPGLQPLPPPFGTVYQFDANGLILPTPEGIVTPEGVRLVLGKPSRVPPARPSELAPPPVQAAAPEASGDLPASAPAETAAASVAGVVAAPAEPAADLPAPDPALAGARPRARPADLTPGPDDDAALPQPADTQLTSLRPRARPAALFAAAETASAAEAAAIRSASASLAATATEAAQISPLAVAVSRKPAPRPRDFSRAVEAAVASIAQPPVTAAPEEPVVASAVPEPRPTAGAIPQAKPAKPAPAAKPKEEPPPDEIDEPEVASAAPDLPTRTNVAKQATFRNAINLSRINLIGVYGSSSNRYALVRQPNGRYIKVEVGDRVDGGKVAAISERELRYVKNGRTVTLAMPKS